MSDVTIQGAGLIKKAMAAAEPHIEKAVKQAIAAAILGGQLRAEDCAMTLTRDQLDLVRQWFNAVQDLNHKYLEPADYRLAVEIHRALGMRVPHSVLRGGGRDRARGEERGKRDRERAGGEQQDDGEAHGAFPLDG